MKSKQSKEPERNGRITKAVSITLELAEWAEGEARRQNRSLSNFVETLLIKKRELETGVAA